MTDDPDASSADLAAAYRSHAVALERGMRERPLSDGDTDIPDTLAGLTRGIVALTLSTQLLEQVSWLERPNDPLPEGVLELATSNVLRLCATIVVALDRALTQVCDDEHLAAMWTIEALRSSRGAVDADRRCRLGPCFSADTSSELMDLATAIGDASVASGAPAAVLAPRLSAAMGRAMAIFTATEPLERRPAIG